MKTGVVTNYNHATRNGRIRQDTALPGDEELYFRLVDRKTPWKDGPLPKEGDRLAYETVLEAGRTSPMAKPWEFENHAEKGRIVLPAPNPRQYARRFEKAGRVKAPQMGMKK